MNRLKILSIISLLVFSVSSNAATIFFGEDTSTAGITLGANSTVARTSFLNNLIGVGNEDFEGFSVGTASPLLLNFPGGLGNITAMLTGTGSIDDTQNYGRFATSGSNFLRTTTGSFGIDFSAPVSAFGFNGIDIGDFVTSQLTLTLTDTFGIETTMVVDHSLNIGNYDQATLFFGFIDTVNSYTSIVFNNVGGSDVFAFDDMLIGDHGQIKVPEPASLALLGFGLIGLSFIRRRKPL